MDILQPIFELDHEDTHIAIDAERAFLKVLEGGCQVPIGGYATLDDGEITLRGVVGSLDGKRIFRSEKKGPLDQNIQLGMDLGKELLDMGAGEILKEIYEN